MADQEELGLPVPEVELFSDDLSSDQIAPSNCAASSSETNTKKKSRRTRRSKSKKSDDGINSTRPATNTADSLFSLITASQIDGAFAQLCIDPQTGELAIPPEFVSTDSMGSCDNGPSVGVDPGKKRVRRRPRLRVKSAKVVNENTEPQQVGLPVGLPSNDGVLFEAGTPVQTALTTKPNLLGRPLLGNSYSVTSGQELLCNNVAEMSQMVSPVPNDVNTNVIGSPPGKTGVGDPSAQTDATESTSKKKKHKKKQGSSGKNVLSPHPSALNEASSSPRTPNGVPRASGTPRAHVKKELFSDYLPETIVQIGLQGKQFVQGSIRINPKSYTEAYIADPEKGQDILIEGIKNRNRALEGDEVVVYVHPSEEWRKQSNNELQKTATVVFLRSKVHPRVAVGLLKPSPDKNPAEALFSPRDARVPRIRVPVACCPPGFAAAPRKFEKILFLASITDWADTRFAVGTLLEAMGPLGDLQAENAAILLENDLVTEPYPPATRSHYPPASYRVTATDVAGREDLRGACVFTIDPATARDLDDAVSARDLGGGRVEVGVHISDVSRFVEEGTEFDGEVAKRATSTYLVDTVYHMLPRELCMLCSLLPGEDKLTYSVFWEMDAEANVISQRFTRSVINSCVQLSYEHAQEMVEHPAKAWSADELPEVHNGFTARHLSSTVNLLHGLAVQLRGRRFAGGALRIDQPKLNFELDRETGRPLGYTCYVNKESHRLIEEFMLLANMSVAEHIYAAFPRLAFLRSHLPPHAHLMDQLRAAMERYGVHLDVSSAGALQQTMRKYEGDDFPSRARMMVLYARCSKPMARARYFCADGVAKDDFSHYALNVPLYTHFTSPIRRYPDIMVHRLLSAALGYCAPPDWAPDDVQKIASNCNKKKFSAKRAGEQSVEIYLSLYVGQLGETLEPAVVVDVKDRSFDVIVCSMGVTQRVYVNNLAGAEVKHSNRDNASKLEITWLASGSVPYPTVQTVEMFSIVNVLLTKAPGVLKIQSELRRPPEPALPFEQ